MTFTGMTLKGAIYALFWAVLVTVSLHGSQAQIQASLPNSILVGHVDGGVIGFQRHAHNETYLLATTSSGALVLNTNPSATTVELTMLENQVDELAARGVKATTTQGNLLEEYDEFGVQSIVEPVATRPIGPKRQLPKTVVNQKNKNKIVANTNVDIPIAEAAVRVPVLKVGGILNIRDHDEGTASRLNPNLHPKNGGSLTVSNSQQWTLVHLDDFDQHANGWSISTNGTVPGESQIPAENNKPGQFTSLSKRRQACNGGVDLHLGGYCEFSKEEVSKTFYNLPPHTSLQVTARFHFFDYWRGEYAYAKVSGLNPKVAPTTVWMHSHAFCSKPFAEYCRGVDACGDNKFADKMSHLVKFTIPHTESHVKLTFGTSLDVDPCKASWAIDDVAVYTRF